MVALYVRSPSRIQALTLHRRLSFVVYLRITLANAPTVKRASPIILRRSDSISMSAIRPHPTLRKLISFCRIDEYSVKNFAEFTFIKESYRKIGCVNQAKVHFSAFQFYNIEYTNHQRIVQIWFTEIKKYIS